MTHTPIIIPNHKSRFYHYIGSLLLSLCLSLFLFYLAFSLLGLSDATAYAVVMNPVVQLAFAALVIIGPVTATIYYARKRRPDLQEYINISVLRYTAAFFMFFYGYVKMYHKFFDITYIAQDSRLVDVDSFFLTWYYFGRSNVQEFMIGMLELVPAIMLLFRRTTFLGAALLLPVSANVTIINIFNHISGLTFFVSLFITLADIYILYSYKEDILRFIRQVDDKPRPERSGAINTLRIIFKVLTIGGMAFFLITTLYANFFHGPSRKYDAYNKLHGGFEFSQISVDGQPITPQKGDTLHYKSIYLEPQARWNSEIDFKGDLRAHAITIKWNARNDSVKTWLKTANDVTATGLDQQTQFSGTYRLIGNKLYIDGVQYGKTIHAVYNKKTDLVDYKWFW